MQSSTALIIHTKDMKEKEPEYKIECECRKPKPGMLLAAAEKYNIDLTQSWMIGDSDNDIEAGQADQM